ncbi:MAG TPA: amidohydrolase family protein [Devosiaceae bacterium]|nr:amidohydrolase family protein [Devosiaceae bacterium]
MGAHVLLRGGSVFTGTTVIEQGFVELDDGRIGRVGAVRDLTGTLEAEVVDTVGMTVLPGLIDTHVHVLHQPHLLKLSEGAAAVWGARALLDALRAGVTTVRDLGTRSPAIFGLKAALAAGYAEGPRLLAAGAALAMTGGHGWHELSVEADGAEALRRAARRELKRGADVIKLMATGGAGTPGQMPGSPQLTRAEMAAAVDEAHRAGKPAAAHALGTEGIVAAVEAGADSIEHGVYLDDRAIELMLARGTVLCPTLSIYRRIVERGPAAGAPDFIVEKSRAIVGPHRESFAKAVRAGVRIVCGTDAGAAYHPVGDLVAEMEMMAEYGMRPLDVLRAATADAAAACGIGQETGTLSPGRVADVVVAPGDALSDLRVLRAPRLVFRAGRRVL